MLIRIILTLLFVSFAAFGQTVTPPPIEPGVSHDLAKWRAAHYSDVRYKLNLTLEKMSPVLKGTIEIRVNVSAAIPDGSPPYQGGVDAALGGRGGSLLILDWRKIRGSEQLSTISAVTVNGRVAENHPVTEAVPPLLREEGSPETPVAFTEQNEHLIFREGVVPGENVIKLDFTSPILTSGSAITRYVDKEDGAEYIYSLFVPSDASTAFPVFDQPDLKARFELIVSHPIEWKIISNAPGNSFFEESFTIGKDCGDCFGNSFSQTKPISTYVFAFAAGPFERVSDLPATSVPTVTKNSSGEELQTTISSAPDWKLPLHHPTPGPLVIRSKPAAIQNVESASPANVVGADSPKTRKVKAELKEAYKNWMNTECCGIMTKEEAKAFRAESAEPLQTSIYVRRSQAGKFKPHAAEVFRLNREGIKYLETYFDYKFPFPKYDIVLIPEFPFGGMEHAGATFLREASVIFPQEPTKNDYISRANVIFHEAAHQWFGDTVTMKWFDDLWLKEAFAEFMAYKTLEKVMPEYNAWKVFYERNKQAAYLTDSTKGTTPIYQEIANLNSAKSAYGNIVYRKAPSFLKQAEFYLGPDKFQTAVRAFLKKHEYANAGWEDLVKEFEAASGKDLMAWANVWVKQRGTPIVRVDLQETVSGDKADYIEVNQKDALNGSSKWEMRFQVLTQSFDDRKTVHQFAFSNKPRNAENRAVIFTGIDQDRTRYVFPNYQDYGYGIFLLDDKSRDYVLKNIQNEKDDFLRTMMWGSLWDSVREAELDPKDYVELVIKYISTEQDETTVQTLLGRVGTAMRYYLSEPPAIAGGLTRSPTNAGTTSGSSTKLQPPAIAGGSDKKGDLQSRLESVLIDRIQNAPTTGQRITFYRAFLNIASTANARRVLMQIYNEDIGIGGGNTKMRPGTATIGGKLVRAANPVIDLRIKDRYDIVTKLLSLGDPAAPALLDELIRIDTTDDAKRYAYAARAAIPTKENREKYWNDFVNNKDISESWIEAAFTPFNSTRHTELSLPYLERALKELPTLKRSRKIFFVNGWLGAFIGGQRSEQALAIINKFLTDNPTLDKDLRLKILENSDLIERAVRIRGKFKSN